MPRLAVAAAAPTPPTASPASLAGFPMLGRLGGFGVLAGLAGFLLFGWGPAWLGVDLPGQTWGKAALIRVAGSILMALACCATPFALAPSRAVSP